MIHRAIAFANIDVKDFALDDPGRFLSNTWKLLPESNVPLRSRGGFSTKIHLSVDGLGNSLRFKLTAGQRHDITQAEALVTGYDTDYVIADKSYDADAFRQLLSDQGTIPVIPPRANRKHLYDYDTHLYKERHLVECFINKIKQFRRVFSRFEKLASRYLGFLNLSAALIWLR